MSEEIKHYPRPPVQPATLATQSGPRPCQVGHGSPHLLAIRLHDAHQHYEQEFGRPPQERDISGLDGWAQVEWLDQAVATRHVPKLVTYTPPVPYRVFRLIHGDRVDPINVPPPQATPDL